MNDPIILDLLSYWEGLRAGRIVPARSDIDPREIKSALEHTFIVEQVRNGPPRIRLAGMSVCDLLGMELRGMPVRSLITPPYREAFDGIFDRVMRTPQITEVVLQCELPHCKIANARMLLLPLKDQDGQISRVLGCISLNSKLRSAPMRFNISDIKETRIVAGEAVQRTATPAPEFAEPAAAFDHGDTCQLREVANNRNPQKTPAESGRPYLRLVKDDD